MQQQHNEILFFKVFHNKYLRCYILNNIKSTGNKDIFSNIETRQDYNSIISLEWMLKNHQYEMIMDKVKSGHYVHINNKSIKSLITSCKRYDIYEVLFKYKRNDMERIDLIEESVKLNSLFALKSFIQLNGGIDSVANTIRNNGTGEYTSLLDIALSFASMDVANYLLLTPGLDWYTESMLLHNTLSYKLDYYSKSEKQPQQEKQSKLNNKIISYQTKIENYIQLLSFINENHTTTATTNITTTRSTIIYKSIKLKLKSIIDRMNIELKEYIKKINQDSTEVAMNQYYPVDNVLEFIDKQLHHSIDKLINNSNINYNINKKKKNNQQQPLYRNSTINIRTIVDLSLQCNQFNDLEMYHYFYCFNMVPFQINYRDHVNYIKYLMLRHSTYKGNKYLSEIISLFKSIQNDQSIDTHQILQLCFVHKLPGLDQTIQYIPPFPSYYKYYIDYYFHKSDFNPIEKVIKHLNTLSINHLWLLVLYNLSIKGITFYKDTVLKQYLSIEIFSSVPTNLCNCESLFKTLIKTNLNMDQLASYQQVEQFIGYCLNNEDSNGPLSITWELIFKQLFENYPINYLISLFSFSQVVELKFNKWVNSISKYLPILPFKPHLVNGEIQFDKVDLFFKYFKGSGELALLKVFPISNCNSNSSSSSNNEIDFDHYKFSILEKVKLVNYLIQFRFEILVQYNQQQQQDGKEYQILIPFLNSLFNNDDQPTLDESIQAYTTLNRMVINNLDCKILKEEFENQTLENCLFNKLLVNSIFGNDASTVNSIISLVNRHGHNGGSTDTVYQLSNMKTDNINDKIDYIKFMYSSGLVSSFGCSLSLLMVEKLILEIGICSIENEPLVQLVKLMNESRKFTKYINESLIIVSLNNGFNRVIDYLCDDGDGSGIKMVIEYNQIEYSIMNEFTNQLIENHGNELDSLYLLFLNGNYDNTLTVFKNIESNIIFGSKKTFYFESILKLSIKHCKFSIWLEIYQHVIPRLYNSLYQYKHKLKSRLFKYVFKYNRLDILEYILKQQPQEEEEEGQLNLKSLQKSFKKGYYQIVNYLLVNNSFGLESILKKESIIDTLFLLSLQNGYTGITDLIISTFKNYNFTILNSQISLIVNHGCSIVLKYIINNNFTIQEKEKKTIRSITKCKSNDNTFKKMLITYIKKQHKNIKKLEYLHFQNRIINLKDTLS